METLPAESSLRHRTLAAMPEAATAMLRSSQETVVPAIQTLDSGWLAEQVRLRGVMWGTADRRVLGTLWWYSAAPLLITPAVASHMATGSPLSPRLEDVVFHHHESSRLTGADSDAQLVPGGTEPLADSLRETFGRCINVLTQFVPRPRPLWAIAADAIAERYLWAGRALGRTDEAAATATEVARIVGPPMPLPRFRDDPPEIGFELPSPTPQRHLRRCSCCLLYLAPNRQSCSNCPRRDATDRKQRLSVATAGGVGPCSARNS